MPNPPTDQFYILAVQNPDKGQKWSLVAGPYESEAMAVGNQADATREYAARHHQPEWFAGATISVVQSEMKIPTALGPIQANDHRPTAAPARRRIAANSRSLILTVAWTADRGPEPPPRATSRT